MLQTELLGQRLSGLPLWGLSSPSLKGLNPRVEKPLGREVATITGSMNLETVLGLNTCFSISVSSTPGLCNLGQVM